MAPLQVKGDSVLEMWEIQDVADHIVLQVPSLQALVGQLNEAGKPLAVLCGAGVVGATGFVAVRLCVCEREEKRGACLSTWLLPSCGL